MHVVYITFISQHNMYSAEIRRQFYWGNPLSLDRYSIYQELGYVCSSKSAALVGPVGGDL